MLTSLQLASLLIVANAGMSSPPLLEADVPMPPAYERVGFAVDAGAPEGVGVSFTLRPLSWVRLSLGPATNGAAIGARAGVTLSPLRTFFRPTLSVQAGRFGEGDAHRLAQFFAGGDFRGSSFLRRVQYDFASAHLGFEIGRPDGTSFFLRGGMSRTLVRFNGFESALRGELDDPSLTVTAPQLNLTTPSVQAGLLFSIH